MGQMVRIKINPVPNPKNIAKPIQDIKMLKVLTESISPTKNDTIERTNVNFNPIVFYIFIAIVAVNISQRNITTKSQSYIKSY